jgi:ribosomal protein S12 methylthiotransferase
MAGFPGETDADHEILADFLREARFDYVGVFSYSAEEGTVAATKAHQVPDDVKLTRAQELRDIADEVGFAQTAAYVGSVQHVLIEGEDENGELIGRSCGQAPEVDGLVIVEGEAPRGEFIDVRITESIGYDMVGVPA